VMSSPEVPDGFSEEQVEEAIITPPAVDQLEHKAVEKADETAISAPEQDLDHKDDQAEIHDEPQSIDPDVQRKLAEQPVVENKPATSGESKEGPAYNTQSPPLATTEASNEERNQEQEHEHGPVNPDHHQPDDMDTILKDQGEDDETIDSSNEHSDYDENDLFEHYHQHLQQDDDDVGAEPQLSSVVGTGMEEKEEDAAEEDARRKRVAERLAKMGGINPFAAPLLSPPSSEDIGHVDSPVVSSHTSPTRTGLPMSSDTPTTTASLPSHEVAEPHPLSVVESKVEEEQGEREISDGK